MKSKLKQTKIIATLGPASDSEETLKSMIDAGVDVIRINASHCNDAKDIQRLIDLVRSVSNEVKPDLCLL